MTGVIDRLEAAGFVWREDDPNDRRRVLIRVNRRRYKDIARLFEPFGKAMTEMGSRYSEQELTTILDFMTRSAELLRQAALELRRQAPSARGEASSTRKPPSKKPGTHRERRGKGAG
ncbi:MAG: MarR family transcriptional regulator [Isosphaeraceae bacterium]